ncbi:SDR family NAD(P)-dependent oxidoreductase [Aurantiacibacter poecillastricola]|uniref:SDR family NAD(P)-dependent oxidoreductase n=1 Tax=Aurantiacibacter poecillastricola TaxID=3064385 RepID=UPI00273FF050|nr:SDR family NAD(P)-dependent oxidoreductase [Aurantiacibacter sp. 219JJ12-13]MDP5262152.1 SDR family NAD(P)-dependent oxidoreductase [Aurantiacibacter sp. 219JJ12-13]
MTWHKAAIFGSSGGIGAALVADLADRGVKVFAGSRAGEGPDRPGVTPFRFDFDDERTIATAAENWRDDPPDLVIVASGVLTLADGTGPERSLKSIDAEAMARVLHVNTIGPALVAKHALPLFARNAPATFAAISARVGSISDNRIGGWHSYRASKAALNMLLRNFAIELGRTHKQAIVAGLHPGTVDTPLSAPFQSNLPEGQLTSPEESAASMLRVLEGLSPEGSGQVFDYKGERVPE